MNFFCGIDIGSLSTDAVIINDDLEILSYIVIATKSNAGNAAEIALNAALKKIDLSKDDLSYIVTTGYGRHSTDLAQKSFTEITCHGIGARYFLSNARCVIDVGGQDCKIIKISEDGKVEDFLMNDKCAAGTGRFIEVMAKSLEANLYDMGEISRSSVNNIKITSTCTVFAESEVVALVAKNIPKADIIKGIHSSIASRLYSMINRMKVFPPYIMTGGVAKNSGVVDELARFLNEEIYIPEEPQIVGAVGAAILAKKEYNSGC